MEEVIKELEVFIRSIQITMKKAGFSDTTSIVINKNSYNVYETLHFESQRTQK